ncbi:sensor histidine kinase [Paenibacillus sp. 481]|uniref:sensor histidine kinase n=1 Tax=Paenibacillus sp. 481 TaxID=2835869 RepID=UPI001E4418B9|nr:ATP-binding protein [Paenibacillus sp. 481]UHA73148.1 HAMP domain-containing protein [Paenibacillus sp. 481]
MRKRGITLRWFTLTSALLVGFYILLTAAQLFLFEGFYEKQKINSLKNNFSNFTQQYVEEQWDEGRVYNESAQFVKNNQTQVAFIKPNGDIIYKSPFRIDLQTEQGSMERIPLFSFYNQIEVIKAKIKKGDYITVRGDYILEGYEKGFDPYHIQKNETQFFTSYIDESDVPLLHPISGTVMNIEFPDDQTATIREGILVDAVDHWFPLSESSLATLRQGERVEAEWMDTWSGLRNVILIEPVMKGGQLDTLIFALSSLQEVGELFNALKLFYAYIGIGGMVLIVLLSLLFSKIVTQPIIEMNRVALRMAKLDFTAVSHIERNDELGSLAASLNSLSYNLQRSLNELKLANEQLVADMERKLQIEQLQKEFIANASHELKTPLSIVKGFAEGLQDHVAEHKRARYVEVILDETNRMETLVHDMLELAKLESRSIRLNYSSFPLRELVANIVDKLMNHLQDKQLSIVVHGLEDACVHADRTRVEQVLMNVLVNAIRHADTGSMLAITLGVEETHSQPEQDRSIRIAIENKGDRIPHDQLEWIWDRFYRGDQSRNRKFGGTGLGLAIAKHILELHQSSYDVKNTEQGVAFYFTLKQSSNFFPSSL